LNLAATACRSLYSSPKNALMLFYLRRQRY
jgi:hypothetical protein